MRREKAFNGRQCIAPGFHYVVTGATVDVDIDKPRRQDAIVKIHYATILRESPVSPAKSLPPLLQHRPKVTAARFVPGE